MQGVPYLAGLGLGASLIVAIGAQNAFVLRQGLRRSHALPVAAICVAVDWTLIAAGALGFGALVERFPSLMAIAAWGGAAYLIAHGALAFRSAASPGSLHTEDAENPGGQRLTSAIVATLAVSLLNPHVYLDTVVLLGSVASRYAPGPRLAFVGGAYTASALWFFGLALGARALAGPFSSERAWRVLDLAIGTIMWWIAATLIWGQLPG